MWNLNFINIVIKRVIWGKLSTRDFLSEDWLFLKQPRARMKISICEAGPEDPRAPRSQVPTKQPLRLHAGSPPAGRAASLCAQPALVPEGVAQSPCFLSTVHFFGHCYNLEVPASSCSISAEQRGSRAAQDLDSYPLISNTVNWKEQRTKMVFLFFS